MVKWQGGRAITGLGKKKPKRTGEKKKRREEVGAGNMTRTLNVADAGQGGGSSINDGRAWMNRRAGRSTERKTRGRNAWNDGEVSGGCGGGARKLSRSSRL